MSRDLVAGARALFDAIALLVRAGVSGPEVEELARRGSGFLAQDIAERDGEAKRKRGARAVSADARASSLSLLDQDQREQEGERERESGVRLCAAKDVGTDLASAPTPLPVRSPGETGASLDAAPTPAQDAATARVGLRDPRGAWLAFLAHRRARKRDPHDLAAWVTWATRAKRYEDQDAARAPPVDPQQQTFDDWRARDKLQAEERLKLARESVPAPPEWLAAVARLAKAPHDRSKEKNHEEDSVAISTG